MRTAIVTLFGFAMLTLCPNVCPMNTADAADMSAHNMMKMDMGDKNMNHTSEQKKACTHCDETVSLEGALLQQIVQTSTVSVCDTTACIESIVTPTEPGYTKAQPATGPPITSKQIKTVVLRT